MDEAAIVIMLKDEKTGILTTELASCKITENEEYLVNIFAVGSENKYTAHIKLSTGRYVSDWEFDAIYDYYDEAIMLSFVESFEEVEDCYDPTWELTVAFTESDKEGFTALLQRILLAHKEEMCQVFEIIKDKENEYK